MTCDESRDLMLDVLYGEEVNSTNCFHFFKHLDACPDCSGEYRELLTTREKLRVWEVEEPRTAAKSAARISSRPRLNVFAGGWWPTLLKLAAGVLIVLGITSIIQSHGYLGGERKIVSQQQLTEMVRDMVVAQQAEERRLVGQALVLLREDVDLQRRQDREEFSNLVYSLEQRYADVLEENNRSLKTISNRLR